MFNQGDNRGFDLINHAIRMGNMGEALSLQQNDLLRQLSGANPAFMNRPTQAHQQPQSVLSQKQSSTIPQISGTERLNPNAFQFPWKLHDMLDNAAADGFEDVVSWQENGRSFRVHKPPRFVEAVMAIYFKQTKYKSFQRQLNLYGFTRINEGPAKGGYRHKYFARGQRSLCQLISRSSTGDAPAGSEPGSPCLYDSVTRTASAPDISLSADVRRRVSTTGSSVEQPNVKRDTRDTPAVSSSSNNSATTETSMDTGEDDRDRDRKMDDTYKALIHKEFQFPWKLHEMLDKSAIDAFEHIVSWQPGELCFKVHDPTKFVQGVMPRFFKQTKYKSFQRQLNLYGFVRIDEGPNKGAYRHKCFLKGRKDLLNNMSRQKIRNEKLQGNNQEEQSLPEETAVPMKTERRASASLHPPSTSGIPGILAAISCTDGEASENEEDGKVSSFDGLSWRQNPSESFSDWRIEVLQRDTQKKETYHVHRRVLAVGPKRSEYFARLFKKANSSNKSAIELGSVEAKVFPSVLDHMYTDSKMHLDTEKAYALYSLAEHLEITSVLQSVTEFYSKKMTKGNVVDFLTIAESFRDKTLLQAAVGRCAEEMRSMDQETAAKLKPEILLEVLLKSKTLPRNYKCGSGHWSQLVAECVNIHSSTLTRDIFQRLTEKENLPYIESTAAIKLLAAENKLLNGGKTSPLSADTSLRERCVFSISKNWEDTRAECEMDSALAESMIGISSSVLYEILMQTTGPESSE
jgi:hypothetical protein